MLHSMTGFARASAESGSGRLTWEIRAVNHRYLDVQFRLPEELRPYEQALRAQVTGHVRRGKVDCVLAVRRAVDEDSELELNTELVRILADRLATIAGMLEDTRGIDPLDILRWPGVVRAAEIDGEPLFEEARGLLGVALDELTGMRRSEGGRIAAMILERCGDIDRLAMSIRARMPQVLDAAREKMLERLARLEVDGEPGRLEAELALVAQKLDVDEEVDRLSSHVSEIRDSVGKPEPVGRRLDFLMQELNREANTLGSKSADAETTNAAVELKVLIEQMREQVQNVE